MQIAIFRQKESLLCLRCGTATSASRAHRLIDIICAYVWSLEGCPVSGNDVLCCIVMPRLLVAPPSPGETRPPSPGMIHRIAEGKCLAIAPALFVGRALCACVRQGNCRSSNLQLESIYVDKLDQYQLPLK